MSGGIDNHTRQRCKEAIRQQMESRILDAIAEAERDQGLSSDRTRVDRLESIGEAIKAKALGCHRLVKHPMSDDEFELYLEVVDDIISELKRRAAC